MTRDFSSDDNPETRESPDPSSPRAPLAPGGSSPLEKEYGEYLEFLAEETESEPGALAALSLRPELSPEEILSSWDLIKETRGAISKGRGPDLSLHLDLEPLLEKLSKEGAVLSPEELLLIKSEALCSQNLKKYLSPLKESSPLLSIESELLGDYEDFLKVMERSLSPEGEILDTASDELYRIRREIGSARSLITEKLSSLMRSEAYKPIVQDEIVTIRKDRYVIPVRASGTGKSVGITHDWSQSGRTAYLEPLETVEDNNHINYLKKKEQGEIWKILSRLSLMGSEIALSLKVSGKVLTKLDLYFALGRISFKWYGSSPEYIPGGGYRLLGLRHPLLEKRLKSEGRSMTPLDFTIEKDSPVIVISGLNAGGKTVALKTLGLNLLLAKSGIMPHSREAGHLDFPQKILSVMGDNQDLSSDLSTFSGHINALIKVLDEAGPGTLILIDELGGGTDPQEGQALALAVLEHLKLSGALVLTATHFHLVKSWAALTPGIVSVSVNTGEDGAPVYGLSYGTPGFSGGLRMAKKLGLPDFLIEKARSYLDPGYKKSSDLLKDLDEARASLIKEKEELEIERRSLEDTRQELKLQRQREAEKLRRDVKDKNLQTRMALARFRQDFEELKKVLEDSLKKGEKPSLLSFQVRRAEMENALQIGIKELSLPDDKTIEPAPEDLQPGDHVYIIKLKSHGRILTWNQAKGEGAVQRGNMVVKASLQELGAPDPIYLKKDHEKPRLSFPSPPPDILLKPLMLIGSTIDDALPMIAKEIDSALLSGKSSITIVHGHGTGRLKAAIQKYLKDHPRVKDFKSPSGEPGGSGRTEVILDL
jgi:DNA mismatch repair protein MutS2